VKETEAELQHERAYAQMMAERQIKRQQVQVQIYHGVAMASAAAVAKVSHTAYAPSIYQLVKRGERIIDWIWRWSAVPLLGPKIMDWLAGQLDRLTDQLDNKSTADITNSN
jgi:trans-aconitate methyltransferase